MHNISKNLASFVFFVLIHFAQFVLFLVGNVMFECVR